MQGLLTPPHSADELGRLWFGGSAEAQAPVSVTEAAASSLARRTRR